MNKFLIQTIDGQVRHDFSFHLLQAIDYHNWLLNQTIYDYQLSEKVEGDYQGYIPVGSLEFIFNYLNHYHNIQKEHIRPINIPRLLRTDEFLGRKCYIAKKEDIVIQPSSLLFVKSHSQYKKFAEIINSSTLDSLPEDEYIVSELLDIQSEWRAFVHQGELVGIQHYLGDFTIFPDIRAVKNMIQAYTDAPPAFTLDVGIAKEKTIVIEVHPFVSCGLYGFNDYKRLPQMFIDGFTYFRKSSSDEGIN